MKLSDIDKKTIKLINLLSEDDRERCLKSNNFIFFLVDESFTGAVPNMNQRLAERTLYLKMLGEVTSIVEILSVRNINYCIFKGVILANRICREPYLRKKGDIDIYVDNDQLFKTLEVLKDRGYRISEANGLDNPHHIVLEHNEYTIELHKSFILPVLKINEDYLKSKVEFFYFKGYKIRTLNVTGSLLHLFYHLYMDIYLSTRDEYALYLYKERNILSNIIYRVYEILLFINVYRCDVRWDEFINDINGQILRKEFWCVFFLIDLYFHGIIPKSVINKVKSKEYINQMGPLASYFFTQFETGKGGRVENMILDFVNNERNKKNPPEILFGQKTYIGSKHYGEAEACLSYISNKCEGTLVVKVKQEKLYINDGGDVYDTVKNAGVGVLLYNDTKYAYTSLFFCIKNSTCPEIVISDINAVKLIEENSVEAKIELISEGYVLRITFKYDFVKKYNLSESFYLGIFLSDVDQTTRLRKPGYIGTGKEKTWFSPSEFIKISKE